MLCDQRCMPQGKIEESDMTAARATALGNRNLTSKRLVARRMKIADVVGAVLGTKLGEKGRVELEGKKRDGERVWRF